MLLQLQLKLQLQLLHLRLRLAQVKALQRKVSHLPMASLAKDNIDTTTLNLTTQESKGYGFMSYLNEAQMTHEDCLRGGTGSDGKVSVFRLHVGRFWRGHDDYDQS